MAIKVLREIEHTGWQRREDFTLAGNSSVQVSIDLLRDYDAHVGRNVGIIKNNVG